MTFTPQDQSQYEQYVASLNKRGIKRNPGAGSTNALPPPVNLNQEMNYFQANPNENYWQNPKRIARYYSLLNNPPKGWIKPDWLDYGTMNDMYRYFELSYGGKPWYQWDEKVADDDPIREYLKTLPLPTKDMMPEREWHLLPEETQTAPYNFDQTAGESGMSEEDWAKLPEWQKFLIPLLSSGGWKAGATMGFATSAPIGVVAGLTASPVAGLAVTGIGTLLGMGLGAVGQSAPWAQKVFNSLDILAEGVERTVGLGWQIGASMTDEEKYGALETVLNNLPASWRAGTFAYDAMASANKGRVVQLGQAEPIQLDDNMIGAAGIAMARQDIADILSGKSTASLEEIYDHYRDLFGFTGMATDLVGHMILDPLNFAGMGGKTVVGKIAKLTNNDLLTKVVARSLKGDGITRIGLNYKRALRGTKSLDDFANSNPFERWFAEVGLDKATGKPYDKQMKTTSVYDVGVGKLLRWVPGVNIPWLMHYSPEAKAVDMTFRVFDNIRQDLAFQQPAQSVQHMKAWATQAPETLAGVKLPGTASSVENAVIPLALRGTVNDMDDFLKFAWDLPTIKREFILDASAAMGKTPSELLRFIKDGNGSNEAIRAMANELSNLPGAEARRALEYLTDPDNPITGAKFYEMADDFMTGRAVLSADEFNSVLIKRAVENIERFSKDYFGVKPESWLYKIGATIKAAQLMAVLGVNPAFLLNNLFDNNVVIAYDGFFKIMSKDVREGFFQENFGMIPSRYAEGVSAAETRIDSQSWSPGKIISDARRNRKTVTDAEGNVTQVRDARDHMNEFNSKYAYAAKGSSSVESASSQMVFTVATMRFLRNGWKLDVGFKPLPPNVAAELTGIGIDPSGIYGKIAGNTNANKMNQAVWNGNALPTLEAMMPDDAIQALKDSGIYDPLIREVSLINPKKKVIDKNGVIIEIDKTPQEIFPEVARALKKVEDDVQRGIDEQMLNEIDVMEEEAFVQSLASGHHGAMERFDLLSGEDAEFNINHMDDMEGMYESMGELDDYQRRIFHDETVRKFNLERMKHDHRQTRQMQGVVRALEGGGSEGARSANVIRTMFEKRHNNNRVFFADRDKFWSDYYAATHLRSAEAEKDLLSALKRIFGDDVIDEIVQKTPDEFKLDTYKALTKDAVSKMYDEVFAEDVLIQKQMDEVYVKGFASHFGSEDLARQWREGVLNVKYKMAAAQRYFRGLYKTDALTDNMGYAYKRYVSPNDLLDPEVKKAIDLVKQGKDLHQTWGAERLELWNKFDQTVYKPLIADQLVQNRRQTDDLYRQTQSAEANRIRQARNKKAALEKNKADKAAAEKRRQTAGMSAQDIAKEERRVKYEDILNRGGVIERGLLAEFPDMLAKLEVNRNKRTAASVAIDPRIVELDPDLPMARADIEQAKKLIFIELDKNKVLVTDDVAEVRRKRAIEESLRVKLNAFKRKSKNFDALAKALENNRPVKRSFLEEFPTLLEHAEKTKPGLIVDDIPAKVVDATAPKIEKVTAKRTTTEIKKGNEPEKPVDNPNVVTAADTARAEYLKRRAHIDGLEKPITAIDNIISSKETEIGPIIKAFRDKKSTPEEINKLADYVDSLNDKLDIELSKLSPGTDKHKSLENKIDELDRQQSYMRREYMLWKNTNPDTLGRGVLPEGNAIANATAEYQPGLQPLGREKIFELLTEKFGLNDDDKNFIMHYADIMAEKWSDGNGRMPQEWYDNIADVIEGGGDIAAVSFANDGKAIIHALSKKGTSREVMHEMAYIWLRSSRGVRDDYVMEITKWLNDEYGYALPDDWLDAPVGMYRDAHESWAYTFKRAVAKDNIRGAKGFSAFKQQFNYIVEEMMEWLSSVFTGAKHYKTKMNPEFEKFMDDLLAERPEPYIPATRNVVDPNAQVAANAVPEEVPVVDIPTMQNPPGMIPQAMPTARAQQELFDNQVRPAFNAIRQAYANPENYWSAGIATQIRESGRAQGLSTDQINTLIDQVRSYMGETNESLSEMKYLARKYGEDARDHSLLNYNKKTELDGIAGMIFPYSFWMTHSIAEWSMRALDKPAILANFGRLREFQQTTVNREGFPTRLRDKIGIKWPFLQDWMGGSIYIDPARRAFPFSQFLSGAEQVAEQNNLQYKKAIGILQDMVNNDDLTQEEAMQALESQSGLVWQKVMSQAATEIDAGILNNFDLISTMVQPSLPIQWAYKFIQGREDTISQLPVTKLVQNATAILGLNQGTGVNIEAPLRNALGLPEQSKFYDYYIDRMLSNMAADGTADPTEVVTAMMERSGPIFDMARKRVAQEGIAKYVGASLSLDLFPEGEQRQRAARAKYSQAVDDFANGDDEAINNFFKKYPQYEAQLAAFREPEERVRKFLRSSIWAAYHELPSPNKKLIVKKLGDQFEQAFLDPKTRAYNTITTDQLTAWAQAMGTMAPKTEFTPGFGPGQAEQYLAPEAAQIELMDDKLARQVEDYYDARSAKFPRVLELWGVYFNSDKQTQKKMDTAFPELRQYTKWRERYRADHPDIDAFLQAEEDQRTAKEGITPKTPIPEFVAKYYDTRELLFPGILDKWNTYSTLDKMGKRSYWSSNPDLAAYKKWNDDYKQREPDLKEYIDIQNQAFEDAEFVDQIQAMDDVMFKALVQYNYGMPLSNGAESYLYDFWVANGRPLNDYDAYKKRIAVIAMQ